MIKIALHWKILLGMASGIIFALLMVNFDFGKELIRDWIKPFGTIFINLFADISYAILSSYLFNNSSTKVKRYINVISGICLIGIGIYLFFSRFI